MRCYLFALISSQNITATSHLNLSFKPHIQPAHPTTCTHTNQRTLYIRMSPLHQIFLLLLIIFITPSLALGFKDLPAQVKVQIFCHLKLPPDT